MDSVSDAPASIDPVSALLVVDSVTAAPTHVNPWPTFPIVAPLSGGAGSNWPTLLWSTAWQTAIGAPTLEFSPSGVVGDDIVGNAIGDADNFGEIFGYAVFSYTGPSHPTRITFDWATSDSLVEITVWHDFADADPGPPEFSPLPDAGTLVDYVSLGGAGSQGADGVVFDFTIPESVAKRVGIFVRVALGAAPGVTASIAGTITNTP